MLIKHIYTSRRLRKNGSFLKNRPVQWFVKEDSVLVQCFHDLTEHASSFQKVLFYFMYN